MGSDSRGSVDKPPERRLVERMLAGEEAAFNELADGYFPSLYRFALGRLDGNRELTREIVQTTVCKAISKLASFRFEASLLTWLCACCRNEILMHFRKGKRKAQQVELDEEALDRHALARGDADLAGPQTAMLRRETAQLVHIALDQLPDHYGQALEWKYVDRLSVDEIAKRLGMSPKAAESLLTRSRRAFRQRYEGLDVGSPRHRQHDQIAQGTIGG